MTLITQQLLNGARLRVESRRGCKQLVWLPTLRVGIPQLLPTDSRRASRAAGGRCGVSRCGLRMPRSG